MVLWRKRQENFKEGNAIKHISLKTLKRILWLLFLYIIVVFPSCFDTRRNLIYMLYLEWYDVKLIEKSWSFQKQCVFPLFSEIRDDWQVWTYRLLANHIQYIKV